MVKKKSLYKIKVVYEYQKFSINETLLLIYRSWKFYCILSEMTIKSLVKSINKRVKELI